MDILDNLKKHMHQTIEKSICSIVESSIDSANNCSPVLFIAYSGGIDSSVLLHALAELKKQRLPDLQLHAIYIHHGLSTNADSWADHCRQQCEAWNIPLIIEKVKIDKTFGNIEEQARQARYQAILHHLQHNTTAGIKMLCTAQHLDDQCETFFLALKRGSGPTGLSAMPAMSDFYGYSMLRPLLSISRQQIEQYAQAYHLNWVEDESNQDEHYDRNFLRLKVLPELNQRWPHFSQMVTRSAELCQQQQQLIEELLEDVFLQAVDAQFCLSITQLNLYSAYKRNALLRMWFKLHKVIMPSRKQLDILWQTVSLAKEDSNPQFIIDGKQIRRYKNQLYLLPQYENLTEIVLHWDLKQALTLTDHLGSLQLNPNLSNLCRQPSLDEQVTVRFQAQGDLQIIGRHGSRKIKKLWQEFDIPPWMRTRIPLIYYNDQLITAVGIFVTEQGAGNQLGFELVD